MIHAIPAALNGPVVHAQKMGRDGYVVPLCDAKAKTITNSPALVTCMACLTFLEKARLFAAREPSKQLAQGK